MKDICCIGHITRDKIITPENEFYQAGGTALYMAYGFANLPHDVSFGLITKTGTESADVISKMRADGIDVVNFDSRSTVYFENKYGDDVDIDVELFTWEKLDAVDKIKEAFGL